MVSQSCRVGQEFQSRYIHSDRRIARRRGEDRDAVAVRRCQNADFSQLILLLVLVEYFAEVMIVLSRSHFFLEFRLQHDLS